MLLNYASLSLLFICFFFWLLACSCFFSFRIFFLSFDLFNFFNRQFFYFTLFSLHCFQFFHLFCSFPARNSGFSLLVFLFTLFFTFSPFTLLTAFLLFSHTLPSASWFSLPTSWSFFRGLLFSSTLSSRCSWRSTSLSWFLLYLFNLCFTCFLFQILSLSSFWERFLGCSSWFGP